MEGLAEIPRLEGDALRAVQHRDSHLQIIASAGSGKTEVVAQRVADLFGDGVAPEALVAFTFTERAADEEDGHASSLAIVDYKTRTQPEDEDDGLYDLQLQVYSNAGRREGLDVRAAYVHDLSGDRTSVDVTPGALSTSEATVVQLVDTLVEKKFNASPAKHKCQKCDVKELCRFRSA